MQEELDALQKNRTFELIPVPRGAKVIGCKWVFIVKCNQNGEVTQYKARLVARGFQQTHGIDYHETYSPVVNMNSLRVFLATCCQRRYHIDQLDVDTAFLNGDLQETVFMQPPMGVATDQGMVWRLRRSLYGLKQAAAVSLVSSSSTCSSVAVSQMDASS